MIGRLATQPAVAGVPDAGAGPTPATKISAGLASDLLYQAFYSRTGPATLPALVEDLASGRLQATPISGDAPQPTTLRSRRACSCR